jgi:DsbC/DsbD-like thiol-disulfide interchange protein
MLFALLVALLAGPPVQLTFTTVTDASSAAGVKAGQTVKLHVDVTPKPKMHVYAPGAKDYVPIVLELNSPGVKAGKLAYPKPEDWYFEPTKEHVPVYSSPFRLTQDVTIASTAKPGTFYVTGVLKYQACDDTICYNPTTEPIAWTINVR